MDNAQYLFRLGLIYLGLIRKKKAHLPFLSQTN